MYWRERVELDSRSCIRLWTDLKKDSWVGGGLEEGVDFGVDEVLDEEGSEEDEDGVFVVVVEKRVFEMFTNVAEGRPKSEVGIFTDDAGLEVDIEESGDVKFGGMDGYMSEFVVSLLDG